MRFSILRLLVLLTMVGIWLGLGKLGVLCLLMFGDTHDMPNWWPYVMGPPFFIVVMACCVIVVMVICVFVYAVCEISAAIERGIRSVL